MPNKADADDKRLNHKTALITGASRGIGYAIAESFASQGANLVLSASSAVSYTHLRAHET